jgi:hypothetical protein
MVVYIRLRLQVEVDTFKADPDSRRAAYREDHTRRVVAPEEAGQ